MIYEPRTAKGTKECMHELLGTFERPLDRHRTTVAQFGGGDPLLEIFEADKQLTGEARRFANDG